MAERSAGSAEPADAQRRYRAALAALHEEISLSDTHRNELERHVDEARRRVEAHNEKAAEVDAAFGQLRAEAGVPPPAEESVKASEVHEVRLEYIRWRNRLKRVASQLRDKERLTAGLHLIDFEQLKIENTTLNEKIEERNEDLMKLRKKATTTIHVVTHVKEKLQFVVAENGQLRRQLASLEDEVAQHRDTLTALKRERDSLLGDNARMRDKMPLVGADDLLADFERRKHAVVALRAEVLGLKQHHRDLVEYVEKHAPLLASTAQSLPPRRTGPLDARRTGPAPMSPPIGIAL